MKRKFYLLIVILICIGLAIFHNVNKYFIIPFHLNDLRLTSESSIYFYYVSYVILISTIIYLLITEFIKSRVKTTKLKKIAYHLQIGVYIIILRIAQMKTVPQFLKSRLNLKPWQYGFVLLIFLFSSLYAVFCIYVFDKVTKKFNSNNI
ncbi:hypothetical protein KQI86_01215 [Clostridium sp. MSJ-11]|uniref:Uncharacterized protein n=1 Tax=Clostridium mobile TaxID=2841512 RepID=A0ABS6ECK6_9CLOT|nr:hypothetical protein [Clostridium mobile]MBU5482924.1 hypothetical protein [Clostridium mobile]